MVHTMDKNPVIYIQLKPNLTRLPLNALFEFWLLIIAEDPD